MGMKTEPVYGKIGKIMNKSDIEICKINKSKSHTLDSYLGRGLSMSEAIKQLT